VRDLNKKGLRILVIQESHRLEVAATLNSATSVPDKGLDRVGAARVLLVEDTEDNRQMMRKLLEMSGYQVVEATNGEEAVTVASEQHPQIILMDLSLPLIDGLAATRRIRSLPGLDKVPIIAVSAHDTADFHSEALAAGCNAYITKPINYPELEEIVSRLLPGEH
jgi:two-component system, cell cycle response regulator DivK